MRDAMPRVEETLAGFLSPSSASLWRKPALLTKPCRVTSSLVGEAYAAAGQAGAFLCTTVVLQVYQNVLFKDLDHSEGLRLEAVKELRQATDLAFRTTKQMACAIGHSTWLNTLTILNVLKPQKANKIMLAKPKKIQLTSFKFFF